VDFFAFLRKIHPFGYMGGKQFFYYNNRDNEMTVQATITSGKVGQNHRNVGAYQGVENDTAPTRGFACQETALGRTAIQGKRRILYGYSK
jgi:hypothetical protein